MRQEMPRAADRRRFSKPGLRTRIYVKSDMVGAGKIELLRALRYTGSINAAARQMGLGYKRAWFLLDTIQRCFEAPLFISRPDGTEVTPLGVELITRFDAHTAQVQAVSADFLAWLEAEQRRSPLQGEPGDADTEPEQVSTDQPSS